MTSLDRTRILASADCSELSSARSTPAQRAAFSGGFARPVGLRPEMGRRVESNAKPLRYVCIATRPRYGNTRSQQCPSAFEERAPRIPIACGLVSKYAELARVDAALRVAEHNLLAVHRQHLDRKLLEAQDIYVEVLGLRTRVRRLLGELSDLWVRADGV